VAAAESGGSPEGGGQGGRSRRRSRKAGGRAELQSALDEKASRKLRAREEGDRGIWFGLGMMGLVGWSVAIPTVIGIAVGVWLDKRAPGSGTVSWTLTGLVLGVFVGALNAWFWIQKELEEGR
jgi:ATP synthase protein I